MLSSELTLPVLAMDLETLELRYLSEIQHKERGDNLDQSHQETLDNIEEELVACQRYLHYLTSQPDRAAEVRHHYIILLSFPLPSTVLDKSTNRSTLSADFA